MLVIAFDTSTAQGSVAILRDDKLLSHDSWVRQGSHGELITTSIETCLAAAGIEMSDLEAVVVGIGPGSFTGVRIAVNAAKSLGFSLKLPVYTFDTLEIIANGCTQTDLPLVVIVNAHKNMVFASTFDYLDGQWVRRSELETLEPSQLGQLVSEPHRCLGDGFDEYEEEFPDQIRVQLVRDSLSSDFPDAAVLGKIREKHQPLDWKSVQALYIRESGAEEKLREKTTPKPNK